MELRVKLQKKRLEMKKYIHVKKEDREFIAKAFGVSGRTVYNALHVADPRGGSKLSERIRKLALERGGIWMVECPEVETLFDSDGYMRQVFPNGVMLEFSKEGGYCDVWLKGEKARRYDDVRMRDIEGIQAYAMAL